MRVATWIAAPCCVTLGVAGVMLLPAATPQTGPIKEPEQKPEQAKILKLPGQLTGYEQTHLYFKIAGFVKKWNYDIGDRVKKGDLLAELYVPELVEDVEQHKALAVVAQAKAQHAQQVVKQSKAALVKVMAQIHEAQAAAKAARVKLETAKSDWDRGKKLFDTKAISNEDFANRSFQLDAAKAVLEETESKVLTIQATREWAAAAIGSAEAKAKIAEAQQQAAEAKVRRQQALLDYAMLIAPYDGVIMQRNVNTGDFVAPQLSKGESLFMVTRSDIVRVVVDVPEAAAARVTLGDAAVVEVAALGGMQFKAKVTRTSWVLDTDKRTLRVVIDLPNPKSELRPGMSANVSIMLGAN
jgi:HlyD family secretion protein